MLNILFSPAIYVQLGVPVCNALLAFGEERYDEVCANMNMQLYTRDEVQ